MSVNTYSAGTDSRSFDYDHLDRMTRLASTRYGNDNYTYDALGGLIVESWNFLHADRLQ